MTQPPATRDLLLTYLRVCGGPRHITRICRYMTMHRVSRGATKTMLCRLSKAGAIAHLPNHCYEETRT